MKMISIFIFATLAACAADGEFSVEEEERAPIEELKEIGKLAEFTSYQLRDDRHDKPT